MKKTTRRIDTADNRTDFFERFGIGEHLEHPSFALDDCDFEGVDDDDTN